MSNPGPSHCGMKTPPPAWKQLMQALKSPSAHQQQEVLAILKSSPALMSAFIKQRTAQHQRAQQQMLINKGISPYHDASIQTDGQCRESGNPTGGSQIVDKQGISSYHDASIQMDGQCRESGTPTGGSQTVDKQSNSSYQDVPIQTDGQCRESGTPSGGSQTVDKQGISTYHDPSIQIDDQCRESGTHTGGSQTVDKQGIEKVLEDMGKLLISGNRSDITLQVQEVEFKVHSNILCARSSVLSTMLEHDTVDGMLRIDDCEPDAFEQYLQYIYTGSIRSLSHRTAFSLYRVADKFLAEDLKRLCLEYIRDTLCIQTFCSTVKLALRHGEINLLQRAIDFATLNLPLIIKSAEWQNFNCQHPMEALEVLIKCIRL